jgi:hypothetical membrane protein
LNIDKYLNTQEFMKIHLLANVMKLIKLGFLPGAYILMLLVMFILPFFSVDEYSMVKNTTSHLGAQGAPYAWVMNVAFALLGIATIIDGWVRLSKYWLHKVVLTVFGISFDINRFISARTHCPRH